MPYVVEVAIETAAPLTIDEMERIAFFGGFSSGTPGEHRVETALTVRASDPAAAIVEALGVLAIDGTLVAVEVMTEAEAERRAAASGFPELAGVSEVAAMLGISRQRVHTLRERHEFPAPVAHLAAGPVWRKGDLTTFADGWHRKPGRPRLSA